MWNWDQGRMQYFQFDTLRRMADFIVKQDFKHCSREVICHHTGLEFLPVTYSPWRNYSRIYKLCLLVSEDENGNAQPTKIAHILAQPGTITCDEYMHFLVKATSSPTPALSAWRDLPAIQNLRYPLCFSLKYILTKVIEFNEDMIPIDEIIGAYHQTNFSGHETDTEFCNIIQNWASYPDAISNRNSAYRQARESLKFITQISYLHSAGGNITVSLAREDAIEIFRSLNPVLGPHGMDGDEEIQRLASLFRVGSNTFPELEYKNTILSDVQESGFSEGSKVKKTHIVIERNSKLRHLFFQQNPTAVCDACYLDTRAKYPWSDRVLDLHHVLPLASGTQVDSKRGTLLEDLIPICPTCHRAVHQFYNMYLKSKQVSDFIDKEEAHAVYTHAKNKIRSGGYYVR